MTDQSTDEDTLLGLLADIRTAAGDREGRLMQAELVEHIRGLKARADQAEQLRTEMDAMKGACIPTREDAERQQWKGIDGAIAFHLIDRHADSWHEAARMMHAWRDANLPAEAEALRSALSQCATAIGASAAPECSVEFLACVPREVELVMAKLRVDAERWREVRRGQTLSVVDWVGVHLRAESADTAVDAAIAARKGEGSEG
jgi:hypothetical protein